MAPLALMIIIRALLKRHDAKKKMNCKDTETSRVKSMVSPYQYHFTLHVGFNGAFGASNQSSEFKVQSSEAEIRNFEL
jgi:hypothetical protein